MSVQKFPGKIDSRGNVCIHKVSNALSKTYSSRTSVARILMARSSRNPIAADIIVFWIISGDFLLYCDSDMLCVLSRIASMRRF